MPFPTPKNGVARENVGGTVKEMYDNPLVEAVITLPQASTDKYLVIAIPSAQIEQLRALAE